MARITLFFVCCLIAWPLFAQDDDNSYVVELIEDNLSTPDRQIRLIGIDGLLSSDARVDAITVSDTRGEWLRVNDVQIVWSRLALLAGRLSIDSLTAASIEVIRAPATAPSLPDPEARTIVIPELPVSVNIGALDIKEVSLAEEILGQRAVLSLAGSVAIDSDGVGATLNLVRLDATDAAIALDVGFDPDSKELKVDVTAKEPQGGIVATLVGIPDAPALDMKIAGAGPLNDIALDISLLANNERRVEGTLRLDDAPGGLGFDADLRGRLGFLVTETVRPFFAGESTLRAVGRQIPGGGLELSQLALSTAKLSIDGSLATLPDGFLRRAAFTGRLGNGVDQTVLPFGNGAASIRTGSLRLDFGTGDDDTWSGELIGDSLVFGDITAAAFRLDLGGVASDIDVPDARKLSITAEGGFTGLRGATADITRALGREFQIALNSSWRSGQPFTIDRLRLRGNGTRLEVAGEVADFAFRGRATAAIDRLEPFAGLSGRDLRGGLSLTLDGSVAPLTGGFDLAVDGVSEALKLDLGALDALLAGSTRLAGRVIRDESGLSTRDLVLKNAQVSVTSDGALSSDSADLTFDMALTDLRDLTRSASGAARVEGRAVGTDGEIALTAGISVADGTVLGRSLSNLLAGFTGRLQGGVLTGRLDGDGAFGAGRIALAGDTRIAAEGQSLTGLRLSVGPSSITGDITRQADGLLDGQVSITSSDISDLAALALRDARGAIEAGVAFRPNARGQQITVNVTARGIAVPRATVASAQVRAIVQNAFGVPGVVGSIDFGPATVAGVAISRGRASATLEDNTTAFSSSVSLANGTAFVTQGTLAALATGYRLGIDQLNLRGIGPQVRLAGPAGLMVRGDTLEVQKLDLRVGDGLVTASGRVAETVFLGLDLVDVPLATANAVIDGLGLTGSLSGSATVSGDRARPDIGFDFKAAGIASTLLKEADLPPFDATVAGDGNSDGVSVRAKLLGPANFEATVQGAVPLNNGPLDLAGGLTRFPLALVDRLAGRLGLRGTLDGTFGVSGRLTRPRVRFDITGSGLSAQVVRDNGVPPFDIVAEGSVVNQTITLADARVTGGGGTDFSISGRIPLLLDGLDVAAQGRVPLSIANVTLARSGVRADGILSVGMRASGRLSAPDLSGQVSLAGGTVVAPTINLRLEDIAARAGLSGNRLTFSALSANSSRGGSVSGSGFVTIDPRAGIPADVALRIDALRYTDASILSGVIDGNLAFSGPVLRSPLLAGSLTVAPLEISIPNQLPQSSAFSIDVRHARPSPAVAATLRRAASRRPGTVGARQDGRIRLDVTVDAPNRVFVRGRGLDAELGGRVQVTGTTADLQPNGRFELIRGRLALLGQRIELTSGAIILTGTTVPDLLMVARAVADDFEAQFVLDGPASAPEMRFSSVPDLPDDEIVARVLFRRSISELSPLQVARLASAIAAISGRSGVSIFEQVRDAAGLDDLDFRTSEDGTTTVTAGKYIQENVYSTIEADSTGTTRATINLDVNESITARGSVSSEGESSIGIFFERDY